MNMTRIKRSVYARCTAILMSMLFLFTSLPLTELAAAAADTSGGFSLRLEWGDDDTKNFPDNPTGNKRLEDHGLTREEVEDPDTFISYADSEGTVYARLQVLYRNDQITKEYRPGDLIITVPGIRDAARFPEEYTIETEIAADKASDTNKSYTWSYQYTEANDTYTFTNNFTIEENYVFNGSFEIVFVIDPRQTTHGFSKEGMQAKLRASNVSVTSNSLNYKQVREKDTYELHLTASNPYKYEVLQAVGEAKADLDNSIWVKYSLDGADNWNARDLANPEEFRFYFLTDATNVYMPDDPKALTQLTRYDDQVYRLPDQDGVEHDYYCYTITKDVTKNQGEIVDPYLNDIYVQYRYADKEMVKIPAVAELWGTFYDEVDASGQPIAKSLIQSTNKPENPDGNYGYHDIPGPIYDVYKTTSGKHSETIDRLIGADSNGAIDAADLRSGACEYTSDLELYLNYDRLVNPPIVDDDQSPEAEKEMNQASEEEIVQVSEDEAVQASEEETAQEAEDEAVQASEEETAQAAEEEIAKVSEEETAQAAEEEIAQVSEEETAQVSEEEIIQASEEVTVQASGSGVTGYTVEFVDDFLDIQTIYSENDGLQQLTDEDYHFTAVTIPPYSSVLTNMAVPMSDEAAQGVSIEVWARYAGEDTDYSDGTQTNGYRFLHKIGVNGNEIGKDEDPGIIWDKDEAVTIRFDTDKVVGIKVFYRGMHENIGYPKPANECKGNNDDDLNRQVLVKCSYVFHIPDEKMRYVSTDGSGKLINNMFTNILTIDADGKEEWFNRDMNSDEYQDEQNEYSPYTFERDKNTYWQIYDELYGGVSPDQGFDREKAELPIVEIPNYFRMRGVWLENDRDRATSETYFFNASLEANFSLVDDTTLRHFSLYTVIPEHLKLDDSRYRFKSDGTFDDLLLKDRLKFRTNTTHGDTAPFLANHCTVRLLEDEKYQGRQYLCFDFDFEDDPLVIQWLEIYDLPLYLRRTDLEKDTGTISMTAAVMVHQNENWSSDQKDDQYFENGVWYDLDRDGITDEPASFTTNYTPVVNARETMTKIVKLIETPLSNGRVNPYPDEVRADPTKTPMTYPGGWYTYVLDAELAEADMKDIIFLDVMEPLENSEPGYTENFTQAETTKQKEYGDWQGTFQSVDYSQIQKVLVGQTEEPVVYYSAQEVAIPEYINRETLELSNTSIWSTAPDALGAPVRSIAVDFGSAVARAGTELIMEIHMLAPETFIGKNHLAVNQWHLGYTPVNAVSTLFMPLDSSTSQKMTSNVVPVSYALDNRIVLTKKDNAGQLVDGAKFRLVKDGQEIGTYTVTNGHIIVENLDEGSYYFQETETPSGYILNDKQYPFEVTNKGEVIAEPGDEPTTERNEIVVYNNRKSYVTIKKISEKNEGTGIDGAGFRLYRLGGDGIPLFDGMEFFTGKTYTIDASGSIAETDGDIIGELIIEGLEWDSYYLLETTAPEGYKLLTERIHFDLNAQNDGGYALGTDDAAGDEEPHYSLKVRDPQKPFTVRLVKYELADPYGELTADAQLEETRPIEGAAYDLYTPDGMNLGTYITDENGEIYVEGLAFGSYYFMEKTPAVGYELNPDQIGFRVGPEDIREQTLITIKTADKRATGSVSLQKWDDVSQPVAGAVYALYRAEEITDPDALAEPTETLYPYQEDADAQVQYFRQDSKITTYTTDDYGMLFIRGLEWGSYILREESAPTGYELSDNVFVIVVTPENAASTIEYYDTDKRMKGTVKLTKTKENAKPLESEETEAYAEADRLSGAVFSIFREDGTLYVKGIETGKNYRIETDEDGNRTLVEVSVSSWEKGISIVSGLEWGRYYFQETKAPDGYGLNSNKIRFTVRALSSTKTQEFVVTDPDARCELKVTKKILKKDIILAHGNPTFIFQAVRQDNDGNGTHTYTKTLTFDKDYINDPANVDDDGYVMASVTFSVMPGTYVISEIGVSRYELENIDVKYPTYPEQEDGEPEIEKDKLVAPENLSDYPTTSKTVTVELNNTDSTIDPIEFIFKNKKENQKGTSDTALVSNMIGVKRRLTAIIAEYTGPAVVQSEEQLPDWNSEEEMNQYLKVTAIYDDGKEEIIYFNGSPIDENDKRHYTLKIPETDTDMTITVVYEEDGIKKTDTFNISLQYGMFDWRTVELDGNAWVPTDDPQPFVDANGTHYEGTVVITGYLGNSDIVTFPAEIMQQDTATGIEKLYKVVQVGGVPNGRTDASADTWVYGMTSEEAANRPDANLTNKKDVTDIRFANGITIIGENAFNSDIGHCKVEKLTFPETLVKIMDGAFAGSSNSSALAGKLYIPASVEEIGSRAFYQAYRKGYSTLIFETDNSRLDKIGAFAFAGCTMFSGDLILPDGVTDMCNSAFEDCTGFTGKLHIPASLQEIENYTFSKTKFSQIEFNEKLRKIGYGAFYNNTVITNIAFPEDLQEISVNLKHAEDNRTTMWGAFELCSRLASIEIIGRQAEPGQLVFPDALKKIGINAFKQNFALQGELVLQDNVEVIGYGAFYNCTALTGLRLNEGLKRISTEVDESDEEVLITRDSNEKITRMTTLYGSFETCNSLTGELTIPSTVTQIGYKAFSYCREYKGRVEIPEAVHDIGYGAFANCTFNELILHEGLVNISVPVGSVEVQYVNQMMESGEFKEASPLPIANVGAFASDEFYNVDFKIPDSVETIGYYAFNSCKYASGTLTIGSGVRYIGYFAFAQFGYNAGVGKVTSVLFKENPDYSNMELTIGGYAFANLYSAEGELKLPDYLVSIGINAFQSAFMNGNGATLVLGDEEKSKLTTIGSSAFAGNNGKFGGTLTIPESVTTIGSAAFQSAGFTGSLSIPDNVTTIGGNAFDRCGFNGDLYIGSGIKVTKNQNGVAVPGIGENAFANTSFKGNLTIVAENLVIDRGMFNTTTGYTNKTYEALPFTGTLTIGDGVTAIDNSAFLGAGFQKLVLGENLTSIGDSAFETCVALTGDLEIPDKVETIGTRAFYGCSSFDGYDLYLGKNVKTIGTDAFTNCFFGNLYLPEGLTEIPASAYKNLSFTGSLVIPDTVTKIGNSAFERSTFTGELIIPESVTSIGTGAFYGCSGFTGDLTLHDGLTIGREVFYNCSGLDGDLYIGKGVTFTDAGGYGVFGKCSFKGNLTVLSGNADSGQTLTKDLFNDCKNFQGDLVIGGSITKIDSDAMQIGFKGTLTLQEGIEEIGQGAFWWYPNFTGSLTIPDSVQKLGREAFKNSGFTDDLTIGTGLTSVDTGNDGIFASCGFTGNLTVYSGGYNDDPTLFNQNIIKNCKNFTGTLTVGGNVETLDGNSFQGFTFSDIVLEEGIKTIRSYVFWNCGPLKNKTITIPSSVETLETGIFYQNDGIVHENLTLRVPRKFESQTDPNWKAGIGSVTIEYYD